MSDDPRPTDLPTPADAAAPRDAARPEGAPSDAAPSGDVAAPEPAAAAAVAVAQAERPTLPAAFATPLPGRLQGIHSLDDFEDAARRHLPACVFSYVSSGCETDRSRDANRAAFAEHDWIPRVFTDTSARSLETTLFGETWSAPFGIAPMGLSALSAYRGDIVQARAAAAANIPSILSGTSLIRMEEVQPANPRGWFQAYVPGEPDRIHALLDRVEAAGFRTLVVTADVPVLGNREADLKAGFSTPLKPSLRLALDGLLHPRWLFGTALRTLVNHGMPHFENSYASRGAPVLSSQVLRDFGGRDHLDWEHLALMRKRWRGTLVVKGVLHPADARRAADLGADGVIVSNHGGRQLDGALAPLRALPSIVQILGADVPVMIDSGFRRGSDVLMALALGAKFVFVGRPFNYAGAVGGERGIALAIDLLARELMRNMAMLGIQRPLDAGARHLRPQRGGGPGIFTLRSADAVAPERLGGRRRAEQGASAAEAQQRATGGAGGQAARRRG